MDQSEWNRANGIIMNFMSHNLQELKRKWKEKRTIKPCPTIIHTRNSESHKNDNRNDYNIKLHSAHCSCEPVHTGNMNCVLFRNFKYFIQIQWNSVHTQLLLVSIGMFRGICNRFSSGCNFIFVTKRHLTIDSPDFVWFLLGSALLWFGWFEVCACFHCHLFCF